MGPWLAAWAEERFERHSAVHVISRQQWTAELAEEVAISDSVLFLDCAISSVAGSIQIDKIHTTELQQGLATHHVGASDLLSLGKELYGSQPRTAWLLTIGAGSTELREEFSEAVIAVLPQACKYIEKFVLSSLESSEGNRTNWTRSV